MEAGLEGDLLERGERQGKGGGEAGVGRGQGEEVCRGKKEGGEAGEERKGAGHGLVGATLPFIHAIANVQAVGD